MFMTMLLISIAAAVLATWLRGIFSARFGPGGTAWDYALYLFCGLLPWTMFQETVQTSSTTIVTHANLVKRVVFPLETLPGWAASIGQVLPSTLWIEVIRRILADTTFSSAFVHISTESLFLRFLISMAVVCIFSIPCLAWSHRQLIKHGRVEVRTGA